MVENYEPFNSSEEVWFWFCRSMQSKKDGWRRKHDYSGIVRCCEINDIYKIVKRMHIKSGVTNRHLRVMVKWGNLGVSPYHEKRSKNSEIKLWDEGMKVFSLYLISKGIIENERFY